MDDDELSTAATGGWSHRAEELHTEIWHLLEQGWRANAMSPDDVRRLYRGSKGGAASTDKIPASTWDRVVAARRLGGDGKEASRHLISTLATATPWPDLVVDLYADFVEACRPRRRPAGPAPRATLDGLEPVMYGTIEADDGRDYRSVDRIIFTRATGSEVSGHIFRLWPEEENHLRWTFTGRRHRGFMFLTFAPSRQQDAASTGTLTLQQVSDRPLVLNGSYTRFSSAVGHQLVTRSYRWETTRPQSSMADVALLDVDNTLVSGWTVLEWTRYLATNGVEGASDAAAQLTALMSAYDPEDPGAHDQLADDCSKVYAHVASHGQLELLAQGFVGRTRTRWLRPWVKDLIAELLRHQIGTCQGV